MSLEIDEKFKKKYSDLNVVFKTIDDLVKEANKKYDECYVTC